MSVTVRNLCVVGCFLVILSGGFLFISIFGYFFKPPPTQRFILIAESRFAETIFSIYDTSLKDNRLNYVKKPLVHTCHVEIFKNIQDSTATAHKLKTCLQEILSKIPFVENHNHDLHYYIKDTLYRFCFHNKESCQNLFYQIKGSFASIGVDLNTDEFTPIGDAQKGLYTWVSENLNQGKFFEEGSNLVTTMFLGNTSSSLVMKKSNIIGNVPKSLSTKKVNVFSGEYEVATLDYPCLGVNEALRTQIYTEIEKNRQTETLKMDCFPPNKEHKFLTLTLWTDCRSIPVDADPFRVEYIIRGTGNYGGCVKSIKDMLHSQSKSKRPFINPTYRQLKLNDKKISVVNGLLRFYSLLGINPKSSITQFENSYKSLCFGNNKVTEMDFNFCFNMIYTAEFLSAVDKDLGGIEYPVEVRDVSYEDGMATALASGLLFIATKTVFKLVGLLSFLLSTLIFLSIGIFMLIKSCRIKRNKIYPEKRPVS